MTGEVVTGTGRLATFDAVNRGVAGRRRSRACRSAADAFLRDVAEVEAIEPFEG
jgi:hypothetical protein